MDRASALEELPDAYAAALRLNDAGASHARIARALDMPVESVPRLLEIGASKLDAVQRSRASTDAGGSGTLSPTTSRDEDERGRSWATPAASSTATEPPPR